MEEVWLSVPGYEGVYQVSNMGRVRRGGRVLSPSKDPHGYYCVSLSLGGVVATKRVHKLVLNAFCGEAPFAGAQAAHNNGSPDDNRLVNLRWATPVENQQDVDRHGRRCRGEDVYGAVLKAPDVLRIRERLAAGERNRPIAEDYGVSISTVHLIRHRRIWRHI